MHVGEASGARSADVYTRRDLAEMARTIRAAANYQFGALSGVSSLRPAVALSIAETAYSALATLSSALVGFPEFFDRLHADVMSAIGWAHAAWMSAYGRLHGAA